MDDYTEQIQLLCIIIKFYWTSRICQSESICQNVSLIATSLLMLFSETGNSVFRLTGYKKNLLIHNLKTIHYRILNHKY